MREILKLLFIIQEVDNDWRNKNGYKRVGEGYNKAYRLNPYNPLSYLLIPIVLVVGIIMFGFVGLKEELENTNPFKWH